MTDRQLVTSILRHDSQRAFAQVVERHTARVYARALSIMHDADAAAEVTQQTFIRAYERLSQWHGDDLAPWLSQIAAHTAITLLDSERRRRTVSIDNHHLAAPDTAYTDDHEAQLQRMEAALATLSDADQRLIRLHYYEQQPTATIATTLGLSQSNVLVRLHRIRNHLRKLLQP